MWWWTLLIFTILWINRTTVFSFNIEERDPIAKSAKYTDKGSYFGFSVAQHKSSASSNNIRNNWILVGAPLGQNLQPQTNHSGALFKCPITDNAEDCIQIETDGKRLEEFDYGDDDNPALTGLAPPQRDEIKDGQWLGVTVKSQKPGGKVVVCAHRYIQSPNLTLHHYGLGLCYLLKSNLEVEQEIQPCKGRPVDRLHQQYGFCQVGTSLAFLQDGFTLMGSPGPFTWRGTIFAKEVEGKSFMELDKTMYKGPLNDDPTPINKYSYLGMSVTGGHFFHKNKMAYVAGAPRSELHGQVYFFERHPNVEQLNITYILSGDQFASSFGYEILAVDINKDGFDDLLVGAPFYYEGDRHGGAVYIYTDLRNCLPSPNSANCKPMILKGVAESRFGFSMTSLGDINKDGYNDVAIGAPYEYNSGAIYIYLGSSQGLQPEPSQAIKNRQLKTLGYSLSGGLDMDNNGYPDLLVGAYEIDKAILYRTRPIVDISITIRSEELNNINVTKKGCKNDPYNTENACFSFRSCFKISDVKATHVEVRYAIREIPKKITRVWFRNELFPDNRSPDNVRDITVTDLKQEYCQDETVYINEGVGDILSPLTFLVNYTLANNTINSPILNKTSIKEFQATFQKSCGNDDKCESNLVLKIGSQLESTPLGYILDLGQRAEFTLEANVTNFGESAYEAKMFIVHPEALSYIALNMEKNKTNNVICSYENATLIACNLGNPFPENRTVNARLRFEIKNTKEQKLDLTVFVNSTSIEKSNETRQHLTAILQKIAEYNLQGKSSTPHFFYAGELKEEPKIEHFEDIGDRVSHRYLLVNNGYWVLSDVDVIIYWPYQINVSKKNQWLLYLESTPKIDGGFCFVNPLEIVNPSNLNSTTLHMDEPQNFTMPVTFTANPQKLRTKRDSKNKIDAVTIEGPDGKRRKVVNFDCRSKTAKCAEITCKISKLGKNDQVIIDITSRIWNSTLARDYNKVDWVSIKSLAQVNILDPTVNTSNESKFMDEVEIIGYPGIVLADASLNIWIIVGSVIAGILVLIILSLILYKLGFFKRNRIKDQTLSGNLKKQGESESLLKVNEGKT